MRIAQSAIIMTGRREALTTREEKETLNYWVGDQRPGQQQQNLQGNGTPRQTIAAMLSKPVDFSKPEVNCETAGPRRNTVEDLARDLIDIMLEKLTGKKLDKRLRLEALDIHVDQIQLNLPPEIFAQGGPVRAAQPAPVGWGLEYDRQTTYIEQEKMSFAAAGVIRTTDGREIAFTAEVNMSRQYMEQHSISIREGDAKRKQVDPLVINFGGGTPSLTQAKFQFDLDSDGTEDRISFVASGSGFLALDANNNGRIDNGTELFGPNTGNGFAELSRFDDDGNGWIDEADAVFQQLRLWTKDGEGKDTLSALREKNIGAIYLGNISAQFSMKDDSNTLHGTAQTAGVFLRENGTAGTVQQIDLAV